MASMTRDVLTRRDGTAGPFPPTSPFLGTFAAFGPIAVLVNHGRRLRTLPYAPPCSFEQRHEIVVSVLVRPIALPFEQGSNSGQSTLRPLTMLERSRPADLAGDRLTCCGFGAGRVGQPIIPAMIDRSIRISACARSACGSVRAGCRDSPERISSGAACTLLSIVRHQSQARPAPSCYALFRN